MKVLFEKENKMTGAKTIVTKTKMGIAIETDTDKVFYSDYPKIPKNWKADATDISSQADVWFYQLNGYKPYRTIHKFK